MEAALAALADKSPDLRRQLFDDSGRIRSFVNVFLGDQNIRNLGTAGQPIPVRDQANFSFSRFSFNGDSFTHQGVGQCLGRIILMHFILPNI